MMATATVLLKLFDKHDQRSLEKHFTALSEKELRGFIKKNVKTTLGNQSIAVIKTIFYGSPLNSDDGQNRRMILYEETLKILQQDLPSQLETELIGILLLQMDDFTPQNLDKLASSVLELIRDNENPCGRCFELIPKLLTTISSTNSIPYTDGEISGEQYKRHFISDLGSIKWIPQNATRLATMFREIPLSTTELKFVLEKLLRLFKPMDSSEIPSFTYQLLLLSSKDKNTNLMVLEGILSYFNSENKKQIEKETTMNDDDEFVEIDGHSTEELRHLEGTVILHVTFAMTQNQDLGKEFVKFLKMGQQNPRYVIQPFTIALGLAVTKFQSFQDTIFDVFKSAITKNFKEMELKKSSKWHRLMIPENLYVEKTFLEVVKNSSYGWDYVTQGLVDLGFILMETTSTKTFGRKPNPENGASETIPAESPVSKLGSDILLSVFKTCDLVRSTMLEQILNHIFTKGTSANDYVNLLTNVVQNCPLYVLESVGKIQRTLDCLPMLPPLIAFGLIKAIYPLLRVNMPLKESLMIILRKALFSGQLDCRKIAVTGYLYCLKNFKVLGHLPMSQSSQTALNSQISADVHSRLNPEMNEALCLELLRSLSCALNQQVEIRQLLYEGLYTVLCENKKIQAPILDIYFLRFDKYYETNKSINPPLKLDGIISVKNDKAVRLESLPTLIQYVHKCVSESKSQLETAIFSEEDYDKIQTCDTKLKDMLNSLTDRVIAAELEDFELDKSADYSTATTVGMKNNLLAVTLLGVYEVLIEYLWSLEKSAVTTQKILSMYTNYKSLVAVLKDKGTAKAAGKTTGRAPSAKLPNSLLPVESVTQISVDLFENEDEELAPLRANDDFVRYVLIAAMQKIQVLSKYPVNDKDNPKYFPTVCQLAKALFSYYKNQNDAEITGKVQSLALLCLENFYNIVLAISTRYPNKINLFLANIESNNLNRSSTRNADEDSNRVYNHVCQFQTCVDVILNRDDDDRSVKDIVFLLNTITTLVPFINVDEEEQFDHVFNWIKTQCTKQKLEDANCIKALLSLFFTLINQSKHNFTLIRDLAQDIHYHLGDIDDEIEVEESKNFAIVTEDTAPIIKQLVLQYLDQSLNGVDWVINSLKADLISLNRVDLEENEAAPTQQETRDKKICNVIGTFVLALHELVQTALPAGVGTVVERILKVLVHIYNTLNLFIKYYVAMYNLKVGKLSSRFEKLIKVTGNTLSPKVYSLISYVQVLQSDDAQKENKKRKIASATLKSKVLRETRQIPQLIYSIEQFESSLMQLTKKTKIKFTQNLKPSTSRDFRIDVKAMKFVAREEEDTSDVEEETTGNEVETVTEQVEVQVEAQPEQFSPPAKRARLQSRRKT